MNKIRIARKLEKLGVLNFMSGFCMGGCLIGVILYLIGVFHGKSVAYAIIITIILIALFIIGIITGTTKDRKLKENIIAEL